MATLEQLEKALVNADKAGDADAARKLAAFIKDARKDEANLIPGAHIPGTLVKPEPSLGEKVVGAAETGLTALTGAIGGPVGLAVGGGGQLAANILRGDFGTDEANRLVEQSALGAAGALTYEPRTEVGREYAQALGETVAEIAPPVMPQLAAPGMGMRAVGQAAPAIRAAAGRAGAGVKQVATELAEKAPKPAFGAQSIGAAATPAEAQRIATAKQMPVPFEGAAALTKGQASREYAQLQFEKESAKLAEIGAPLRKRVQNQTATMIQNFDALVDRLDPIATTPRELGAAVNKAVVNKAEIMRRRIRDAYAKAEEAGDMSDPVDVTSVAAVLDEISDFEGVAPNIIPVKKQAEKLGIYSLMPDKAGEIRPSVIRLQDAELLRRRVNDATNWADGTQALFARKIKNAIDDATRGAGGDLYKKARQIRSDFASEFENVGLTAKLLGTKGRTTERQIALEDVFNKVIILSPMDEMNKIRKTLLTAGPDGKRAWNDLKAEGINYIKDRAFSKSQMDEAGRPLLSPDALNNVVKQLDKDGKLESLYGKKQAQILRDLAELSTVIYTAPPGAINTSNTASALRVALDSVTTFTVTGIPAPAVTAIKESLRYVKDRKLKSRINEALKDPQ